MLSSRLHRCRALPVLATALLALSACDDNPTPPAKPKWSLALAELPGALYSAWGSSPTDVWMVGGADPLNKTDGPTILRWNGKAITRLPTDHQGDLWWVAGAPSGNVWMVGTGGLALRWTRASGQIDAPGPLSNLTKAHLFGVLPLADDDVYVVGGDGGCAGDACAGVVLHWDGKAWGTPPGLTPDLLAKAKQWFKAWKCGSTLYIVGSAPASGLKDGEETTVLAWDGKTWSAQKSGQGRNLLTIHGNASLCVAVGGSNSGALVENTGSGWKSVAVKGLPQLNGVFVPAKGNPVVVGANGAVWERKGGTWTERTDTHPEALEDYHGVWVDGEGGIWAVGGQLVNGFLGQFAYFGTQTMPAQKLAFPIFPAKALDTFQEVRKCRGTVEHSGTDASHIRVFADPTNAAAYLKNEAKLPNGTILLKAEYDDPACTNLTGFTAMRKESFAFAKSLGWHWQRTDAQRKITEDGVLPKCVSCHEKCKDRDYACTEP